MSEVEIQQVNKDWLKLYGIYLIVFIVFAIAQLWLLFVGNGDMALRLFSIGLLLLVIGINATLVTLFKPSKNEWARLVRGAGFVSSWLLTVGSLVGFVFNWVGQWGSWQGMARSLGIGGFFYFILALVAWLVTAWLAVKLYQLIMLKLGEIIIEKYQHSTDKQISGRIILKQK